MKTNPNDVTHDPRTEVNQGLTKREHFAALAMQGLVSEWQQYFIGQSESDAQEIIGHRAVMIADALITELNKESGE